MRCLSTHDRPTAILGRSLYLASAYGQLAITDSSRGHAFLSVYKVLGSGRVSPNRWLYRLDQGCPAPDAGCLGWGFDSEGPKSDEYSLWVCALGVKFDLSGCQDGSLGVCNAENRIKEISDLLDGILERDSLKKKDAPMVRDRLACAILLFLECSVR